MCASRMRMRMWNVWGGVLVLLVVLYVQSEDITLNTLLCFHMPIIMLIFYGSNSVRQNPTQLCVYVWIFEFRNTQDVKHKIKNNNNGISSISSANNNNYNVNNNISPSSLTHIFPLHHNRFRVDGIVMTTRKKYNTLHLMNIKNWKKKRMPTQTQCEMCIECVESCDRISFVVRMFLPLSGCCCWLFTCTQHDQHICRQKQQWQLPPSITTNFEHQPDDYYPFESSTTSSTPHSHIRPPHHSRSS